MQSYNDDKRETELIQIRLDSYNEQKILLKEIMYAFDSPLRELKGMVYSDMPPGGQSIDYSVYVEAMRLLETKIEIENRMLKNMLETSKKLDDKMSQFEGIEYKVSYLLMVKGMSLQAIADELKYSLGYIQNISSNIKRERV